MLTSCCRESVRQHLMDLAVVTVAPTFVRASLILQLLPLSLRVWHSPARCVAPDARSAAFMPLVGCSRAKQHRRSACFARSTSSWATTSCSSASSHREAPHTATCHR